MGKEASTGRRALKNSIHLKDTVQISTAASATIRCYGPRVPERKAVDHHEGSGCAAVLWRGLGGHGVHVSCHLSSRKQVAHGLRRDDVRQFLLDGLSAS